MKATDIGDQVRQAIENCGMSRATISRSTGVSEGMLSRFVHGETDMTLRTLARIAPVIGVRVIVKRPKTKGR